MRPPRERPLPPLSPAQIPAGPCWWTRAQATTIMTPALSHASDTASGSRPRFNPNLSPQGQTGCGALCRDHDVQECLPRAPCRPREGPARLVGQELAQQESALGRSVRNDRGLSLSPQSGALYHQPAAKPTILWGCAVDDQLPAPLFIANTIRPMICHLKYVKYLLKFYYITRNLYL